MNKQQSDHATTPPAPEKLTWKAPKLTKHGDIASLTKQWLGPDGLAPNLRPPTSP